MAAIHFETKPYQINSHTVLRLPESASRQLPSRGQVMVKGSLNKAAFQTALEPDGRGGHWLDVEKSLQKSAKITSGDTASLTIEATKDWPEPVIPADIRTALKADEKAHKTWLATSPMARWEWIRWINATSVPATRGRRIEVACSKLTAGSRRPCCFNRNMCCVPDVSKNGVLLEGAK